MFEKKIKKNALNLAIDAEKFVVGLDYQNALRNGRMNYERALCYAEAIVKSRQRQAVKSSQCKILNLSGINAGQCDLVMVTLLRSIIDTPIVWTSYDSELNIHTRNAWLINMFSQKEIELRFADFGLEKYFQSEEKFDVVLLTEVIEHLDYSDALRLMRTTLERLNTNGIILLSVPNPHQLLDRIKFFIGIDPWFDKDIKSHLDNNFYGHVNIYTACRVENIIVALGLKNFSIYTINHWRYSFTDAPIKFLIQKLLDFSKIFIPFAGFTLVAVANKN